MRGYAKVIIDVSNFTDKSINKYCECLDELIIPWYRDINNPVYTNPLVLYISLDSRFDLLMTAKDIFVKKEEKG